MLSTLFSLGQDTVFLRSGDILACFIVEQNEKGVKYKKYPTTKKIYRVSNEKVLRITGKHSIPEAKSIVPGTVPQPESSISVGPKQDEFKNKKRYITWIKMMRPSIKYKGYLYNFNDSLVILQDIKHHAIFTGVKPEQIKKLSLRKKGRNPWKGFGIGLVTGFSLGALIGLAQGDDPPCNNSGCFSFCFRFTAGEKALINGTILTLPGGIIGAFVGGAKVKIPIRGNKGTYLYQKRKLMKYSIR